MIFKELPFCHFLPLNTYTLGKTLEFSWSFIWISWFFKQTENNLTLTQSSHVSAIAYAFLLAYWYIDLRTVKFFPPAESWLVNSNLWRTSRMQNSKPLPDRGSPILFRDVWMGIFALCETWMRIYFFRDSWIYMFPSLETGFRFFRDPWNMYLLLHDFWTNDFCGNNFSFFWRF